MSDRVPPDMPPPTPALDAFAAPPPTAPPVDMPPPIPLAAQASSNASMRIALAVVVGIAFLGVGIFMWGASGGSNEGPTQDFPWPQPSTTPPPPTVEPSIILDVPPGWTDATANYREDYVASNGVESAIEAVWIADVELWQDATSFATASTSRGMPGETTRDRVQARMQAWIEESVTEPVAIAAGPFQTTRGDSGYIATYVLTPRQEAKLISFAVIDVGSTWLLVIVEIESERSDVHDQFIDALASVRLE